jgi:hypothetical protein
MTGARWSLTQANRLPQLAVTVANASAQELVDVLNPEAGNPGWVTARGFYLAALREA